MTFTIMTSIHRAWRPHSHQLQPQPHFLFSVAAALGMRVVKRQRAARVDLCHGIPVNALVGHSTGDIYESGCIVSAEVF